MRQLKTADASEQRNAPVKNAPKIMIKKGRERNAERIKVYTTFLGIAVRLFISAPTANGANDCDCVEGSCEESCVISGVTSVSSTCIFI